MASPPASSTQSAPWELIAKSQGLDGVIDDESRLRALNAFHCAIENDRKRYEEASQTKTHEEQVGLVKSEFNQMQVNEDATIKSGWTDAEVADDVPGEMLFAREGRIVHRKMFHSDATNCFLLLK